MVDHVFPDVVAYGVLVPDRPGQLVPYAVRGGLARVLSDRPAVPSVESADDPGGSAVLGLLWAAWEQRGQTLSAEQWQRPTRLGDWTVRMLYAHAASWLVGFAHLVGQVRQAAPTHASAAELLGEFNRPGGIATSQADRVAAAAQEDAATYTPAQLIEPFSVTGPNAIATARRLGSVVVDYFGRAMLPLAEAVSIGILEATVHLLDLQRALALPPEVPRAGLEHTVELLAAMTPPVDFIELATGRSQVAVFPVLR